MKDLTKLKGLFEVKLIRNGKIIEKRKVKNTITTAGLAEIANLAGNVSTPASFTYLAVGTGTTASASADTALEAEIIDTGLARTSATVSRTTTTTTDDTLTLVYTWTASGVKAVTEAGAFNDASAGVMLGRQVFSTINTVSGDTLELTYNFIFA